MDPLDTFIEALSLLPGVARMRRLAMRTWGEDMPMQLDFALAGAQIAYHLPAYSSDEQAYLRGVLSYGLSHTSGNLRSLVLRPLITAMLEKSQRMGAARERAVLAQLEQVVEWRNASTQHPDAPDEAAASLVHPPDVSMDRPYESPVVRSSAGSARLKPNPHAVHDAPGEAKPHPRRK